MTLFLKSFGILYIVYCRQFHLEVKGVRGDHQYEADHFEINIDYCSIGDINFPSLMTGW
jgi:hypothetical protein